MVLNSKITDFLFFFVFRQSTIDMAKTAKQQLLLAQEKHVKDVEKLKKQVMESKREAGKSTVRVMDIL